MCLTQSPSQPDKIGEEDEGWEGGRYGTREFTDKEFELTILNK